MLSETLTNELESYGIGRRIRTLRLKKAMGLVQLGNHTGMSPGMLSKIERGQMFPTLPTLVRIALVFGVELNHFFDKSGPRVAVTRKADRVRLPIPAGAETASYHFESIDYPLTGRRMEAFVAEFPQGAPASEPHKHGLEEVLYVLNGGLVVTVEDESFTLAEGDAITFDSAQMHSYRPHGEGPATVLVVTCPAS
jgi:mannose-6-phosphate isomerase-like protein (cupin superfamily)